MQMFAPSSFSNNPMALIAPGLRADINRIARGRHVEVEHGFDGITVRMEDSSTLIPFDRLHKAFANDDYAAITAEARYAVLYLSALDGKEQVVRRRRFRTKQRNQRALRH